ncbi:hypothetical protein BraRD5C2_11650 [Bradyrhizobium sp. RD5-C2]|nr:hypothetical protein BraRD5C2_11650 [Bradyrhizobium sp. RD5-C2]
METNGSVRHALRRAEGKFKGHRGTVGRSPDERSDIRGHELPHIAGAHAGYKVD